MCPALLLLSLWVPHGPLRSAPPTTADTGAVSRPAQGAPRPAASISASLSYTGDAMADVAGGARRGVVHLGGAALMLAAPTSRLVGGWNGGRLYVLVLGTYGGAPSGLVGDVQGVSNLQAPAGVRVEEAWLQQDLLDDRLSLLLGRYDLNTEFDRLESAGLFINSSFGISPAFSSSGAEGPSIFPRTSVGGRVAYTPRRGLVLRAALMDGVPVDRPNGSVRIFAPGDGLLLVGEADLLSRPTPSGGGPGERRFVGRGEDHPYKAKLALGAWYYTARYPDLVSTNPDGSPTMRRGSHGLYLIGDVTLWRAPATSAASRTLKAFVQLGLGDGRVNQIGAYAGGGLTLTDPRPGRPSDQVGLAVAVAFDGSHFRRVLADRGQASQGAETAVEATYLVQLFPWLAVQPDVQYVIDPGGAGATPDALLVGVRVAH